MSARYIVLVLSTLILSTPCLAQGFCDTVLRPEVFNVGTTATTLQFASHFKDVFCRTRWTSQSDLEQRSTDAGFSYQDVGEIIGLSFSDADSTEKRNAVYDQFCKKTDEDIAYSRTFYNTFRSSDGAVNAWQQCVLHAEGHFGLSYPDEKLTGALLKLTIRGEGEKPDLEIYSVERSSTEPVECTYNGKSVIGVKFPHNQREVTITCTKPPNAYVKFAINSNWGVFDSFEIPGYSQTIAELQASISKLRAQLRSIHTIQGDKNDCQWSSYELSCASACPPQSVITGGNCEMPNGTAGAPIALHEAKITADGRWACHYLDTKMVPSQIPASVFVRSTPICLVTVE